METTPAPMRVVASVVIEYYILPKIFENDFYWRGVDQDQVALIGAGSTVWQCVYGTLPDIMIYSPFNSISFILSQCYNGKSMIKLEKNHKLRQTWTKVLDNIAEYWNRRYGSLPKTSNTLNIRTPKIIAKINSKMFPKISNTGLFSEIEFLKFRIMSFSPQKRVIHTFYPSLLP